MGESALDRVIGVGEEVTDWERAHLTVGVVRGSETPTGRERT